MEKLYNAKLSFKGDGNFTFMLPNYGELTIYKGRDIFVKNLSVNGIEALRQLRPLLLEHQLNAKPDGCYKVIDLLVNATKSKNLQDRISNIAPKALESVADLKASLVKTQGLIPLDEKRNDDVTIYNPPADNDNNENNEMNEELDKLKAKLEAEEAEKAQKAQQDKAKKPMLNKKDKTKKSGGRTRRK